MIHKAPAAFGLTSVLLKQGLSKRAARGHLIIFSLAAPIGALSTWLLVHLIGGGGMEGESGQWWTGMLLLFSAGTFLWVSLLDTLLALCWEANKNLDMLQCTQCRKMQEITPGTSINPPTDIQKVVAVKGSNQSPKCATRSRLLGECWFHFSPRLGTIIDDEWTDVHVLYVSWRHIIQCIRICIFITLDFSGTAER